MSHAESLPVLFINHDLQHVNKHTNKGLEENKTQSSLTTLSHTHCAPTAASIQHQQERHRIQQEHFNREDNISYFQHVATTPPPEITITGTLRPVLRAITHRMQLLHATALLESIVRRTLV